MFNSSQLEAVLKFDRAYKRGHIGCNVPSIGLFFFFSHTNMLVTGKGSEAYKSRKEKTSSSNNESWDMENTIRK